MTVAKIAISIDNNLLKKLDELVDRNMFDNRSQAIQSAVEAQVIQLSHARLARECEKLDPAEEQVIAEEGLQWDVKEWPEF